LEGNPGVYIRYRGSIYASIDAHAACGQLRIAKLSSFPSATYSATALTAVHSPLARTNKPFATY
jgi:hypothetical protein